jgi:hypothetical protein
MLDLGNTTLLQSQADLSILLERREISRRIQECPEQVLTMQTTKLPERELQLLKSEDQKEPT